MFVEHSRIYLVHAHILGCQSNRHFFCYNVQSQLCCSNENLCIVIVNTVNVWLVTDRLQYFLPPSSLVCIFSAFATTKNKRASTLTAPQTKSPLLSIAVRWSHVHRASDTNQQQLRTTKRKLCMTPSPTTSTPCHPAGAAPTHRPTTTLNFIIMNVGGIMGVRGFALAVAHGFGRSAPSLRFGRTRPRKTSYTRW